MRKIESAPYEYATFGHAYPLLSPIATVPVGAQQPDSDRFIVSAEDEDSLGEELRDKQIIRRFPFMNLAFIITNCSIYFHVMSFIHSLCWTLCVTSAT